jgi:hypothetical protein
MTLYFKENENHYPMAWCGKDLYLAWEPFVNTIPGVTGSGRTTLRKICGDWVKIPNRVSTEYVVAGEALNHNNASTDKHGTHF